MEDKRGKRSLDQRGNQTPRSTSQRATRDGRSPYTSEEIKCCRQEKRKAWSESAIGENSRENAQIRWQKLADQTKKRIATLTLRQCIRAFRLVYPKSGQRTYRRIIIQNLVELCRITADHEKQWAPNGTSSFKVKTGAFLRDKS